MFDKIIGKNKNEVIEYLNSEFIPYQQSTNNKTISFQKTLMDSCFDFIVRFDDDKACYISGEYSENSNFGYNSLSEKCKNYFIENYGEPVYKNETEKSMIVNFQKNDMLISLLGNNDNNRFSVKLTINRQVNDKDDVKNKKKSLIRIGGYISSGLFFGIAMGLAMHTSFIDKRVELAIWISAGLLFAFFFGLANELILRKGTTKKYKLKSYDRFLNVESEMEFKNALSGIVDVYLKMNCKKPKQYISKLYIDSEGFLLIYFKDRNMINQRVDLHEINKGISQGIIRFKVDKSRYQFHLTDKNEFSIIKNYIDEKMGYNTEKYKSIFDCVKNTIIEYNPNNVFNSKREDVLKYEIEFIARSIFEKEKVTLEDIRIIVSDALKILSERIKNELPFFIYKNLSEGKLI